MFPLGREHPRAGSARRAVSVAGDATDEALDVAEIVSAHPCDVAEAPSAWEVSPEHRAPDVVDLHGGDASKRRDRSVQPGVEQPRPAE
jgi:hypothetical protein